MNMHMHMHDTCQYRYDIYQYTYTIHARYMPIHNDTRQYTYDTHNTRIIHVSLCIGMYHACIVVCTGKRGGRHFAVKQGKGPQKGSDSESEAVTDDDDLVEEAEMRSEEDTDEGGPVVEEGDGEEEEEGAEAAGESLKAQAIEEFANSTNGAFKVSGNTGDSLTLALQKLMLYDT